MDIHCFNKAKRQDKTPEDPSYVPTGSSMNTTGSSAVEKGVKITVGLSPSTWYANRTGISYLSADHEIERGICSQHTVLFYMY